jgi:lysophospholipase
MATSAASSITSVISTPSSKRWCFRIPACPSICSRIPQAALIALSAAPYLTTRIDRMVLSAPFIGLTGQSASPRVIRALAGTLPAVGLGFLPLTSKPKEPNFRDNPLTSDEVRFERNVAMMKAHPELTLGPPTARWLIEAFRTMDRVTSPTISSRSPSRPSSSPRRATGSCPTRRRSGFRGISAPANWCRSTAPATRSSRNGISTAAALAAFHAFIPGSDAEAVEAVEGFGT